MRPCNGKTEQQKGVTVISFLRPVQIRTVLDAFKLGERRYA